MACPSEICADNQVEMLLETAYRHVERPCKNLSAKNEGASPPSGALVAPAAEDDSSASSCTIQRFFCKRPVEASLLGSKVALADSVEDPIEPSPLCSKVALADPVEDPLET